MSAAPAVDRVPAPSGIGAQRRVRALIARGWSPKAVEHATGLSAASIRCVLADPQSTSSEVAVAVARTYDQLWDTEPPRRAAAERAAAEAHREHAERRGWPPPMAYDDDTVDLPEGDPSPGWRRTSRTTIPATDLAEDACWVRQRRIPPRQPRRSRDAPGRQHRRSRQSTAKSQLRGQEGSEAG